MAETLKVARIAENCGHGNPTALCVFSQFSQQSNLTAQHQPISDKIEQIFEGSREWEEFEGMGNQRN